MATGIDGKIKLQAAELQELEDARQRAWINECAAAVADKLARIQEPEQLGEKSVCHVEEDAWQEASSEAGEQGIEEKCRNEAVEQDLEAKHSMQEQYLVEGAARQETCKPQIRVEPDLEYGRFGEYIKRRAKLEDRLTDHVEAEIESRAAQWQGLHGRAPEGIGR